MADDVFGIVGTTQAGNFHVEQVVAEGGFGVVYRAIHAGFRAPVALKCLKVSEAKTPRERQLFLEKFREEAQLLFRLSASIPEVVRPLHVDVLHLKRGEFVPFLALEWLDGESLDRVIDRRRLHGEAPIPLHKLMKMMRPIAQAIARAHRFPSPGGTVSIIHRDLKPENIFITNQEGVERLKILDYGIAQAKSLAEQAVGRVTNGDPLNAFSPAYGAPEQWAPKRFGQTGTWTDVWGLALTMVEALVGRQVIEGEAQAMMGTALDVKRRPTPRTEGLGIAPEVDAVFERALAVSPRDRTRDIETFWSELEAALGLAPTFGPRGSALDDAYAASPPPPSSSMRAPGPAKHAAHVWLDTPRDSGSLELDLDVAPASMRAPRGSRRDGPESSARPPPPSDSAGLEMDLPEAPPSARGRALMGAVGDGCPGSARGRAGAAGFAEATPVGAIPRAGGVGGMESAPPSARARAGAMGSMASIASPPPLEVALGASPRTTSMPPSMRPLSDLPSARYGSDMPSARYGSEMPSARYGSEMPSARYRLPPRSPSDMRPRPAADPKQRPAPTLLQQLGLPVACIVFACLLTVADLIMKSSGQGLSFGPVRSFWVAGVLLLFGVGLFFWRMLGDPNDA
ncbi:protein kinase [Sorangium cellulosum]|uniref:Protein kinase n=1 Tax=Sorangium cellulosum TaxID=56 RepID=A0A4V0NDM4_SORCE|nr:serine/threonine-protein kinase [Sorangium cellulosum]AUX23182.1 protein kinase [Sorangium cellulosum]